MAMNGENNDETPLQERRPADLSAAPPTRFRDFVHWRLSDASLRARGPFVCRRHPKIYT